MNGARKQFFAGAGLTVQEYRGPSGCNNRNLVQYFAQGSALADDVLEIML